MPYDETILGIPGYQITKMEKTNWVRISARYTGPIKCPHCRSKRLRKKARFIRKLRHESWGLRHARLELEAYKFLCKDCGRYFNQRFPIEVRNERTAAGQCPTLLASRILAA